MDMAKEKNTVDYFPFFCKEGRAMFYIENKYGNDGFATWVKILRQLASTNYHFLNLQDENELMFISAKCKVEESTLITIVNDLVKLGEFDAELWEDYRVLWSEKFYESILDVYRKRSNDCWDKTSILNHFESKRRNNPTLGRNNLALWRSEGDGKRQTKLNKTKLNKTKLDKTKSEDENFEKFSESDQLDLIEKKQAEKETVTNDLEIWPTFEDFWDAYDKKVGPKEKLKKKFDKLSQRTKEEIMSFVPEYVKSTPDKQFRQNPQTFLNQKSWENEIIRKNEKANGNKKLNYHAIPREQRLAWINSRLSGE